MRRVLGAQFVDLASFKPLHWSISAPERGSRNFSATSHRTEAQAADKTRPWAQMAARQLKPRRISSSSSGVG